MVESKKDLKKAYDLLQIISKDEKARMLYEAKYAEISDQLTRMKSAEEKGRKEGREEGREEGAAKKAEENAVNFLRLGVNEEMVAKGTGLPLEKVLELKNRYQN
ncbi:hypothetical protein ACJDU8_02020 [Clostridium sp. WILCCON 0269]|uniref:Rpn family recombination-promoting nuclease/putative transposase n=1 Tax=Candidatus Clostridium eludens TaxID=3381663 RepID=A0ABW8SF73_9CLOT